MITSENLHLVSLLKRGRSSEPPPLLRSLTGFFFFCLNKEHGCGLKSENGCSKGDLANRREAWKLSHSLSVALQSLPTGWLPTFSSQLPGVKIGGGKLELPRKCVFFPKASAMQSPLGQQGAAVDDSGDDEGK